MGIFQQLNSRLSARYKTLAFSTLVVFGILGALLPSPYQQGQRVLVHQTDGFDDFWYPATVESVQGDRLRLALDDGGGDTVTRDQVRSNFWKTGTRVECRPENNTIYDNGTITGISHSHILVNYDHGDQQQTRIGRCRSRL